MEVVQKGLQIQGQPLIVLGGVGEGQGRLPAAQLLRPHVDGQETDLAPLDRDPHRHPGSGLQGVGPGLAPPGGLLGAGAGHQPPLQQLGQIARYRGQAEGQLPGDLLLGGRLAAVV